MKFLNEEEIKYSQIVTNNVKILKDFSLEEDTLTFSNFSSIYSLGGNCAGITIAEMIAYSGKFPSNMPKIRSKELFLPDRELGKYTITEENKINLNKLKRINLKEEVIFQKILGKEQELTVDFNEYLNDKKLANLLNLISFYQVKQGSYEKEFTIEKGKFDVKEQIIKRLDNNIPVGIGLDSSINQGHAVLAYGYEKINDSTFKVYVTDSNRPIVLLPKDEKQKRQNKEIRNIHILFIKKDNKWQYIFNPNVKNDVSYENQGYYYNGIFNSFIPGSEISIYTN